MGEKRGKSQRRRRPQRAPRRRGGGGDKPFLRVIRGAIPRRIRRRRNLAGRMGGRNRRGRRQHLPARGHHQRGPCGSSQPTTTDDEEESGASATQPRCYLISILVIPRSGEVWRQRLEQEKQLRGVRGDERLGAAPAASYFCLEGCAGDGARLRRRPRSSLHVVASLRGTH